MAEIGKDKIKLGTREGETRLLTICNRRGYLNGRLGRRLGIVEKATVTGPNARTSSPLRRVDSIFVRLTRRLHYPYTRCERNSHSEFSLMNIRSSGPVPRILRNSLRGTRPVNSILTVSTRFSGRIPSLSVGSPDLIIAILFLQRLLFLESNVAFFFPLFLFLPRILLPDFRVSNRRSLHKENQLRNVTFLIDKRIFWRRNVNDIQSHSRVVLIRWLGSVSAKREEERE